MDDAPLNAADARKKLDNALTWVHELLLLGSMKGASCLAC